MGTGRLRAFFTTMMAGDKENQIPRSYMKLGTLPAINTPKHRLHTCSSNSCPSSPTSLFRDRQPHTPRTYHDDESSTPANSGDNEEFPGFFSSQRPDIPNDSKNISITLSSEAAMVSASGGHETYAVTLKVKAPSTAMYGSTDQPSRGTIDLVAVLDVGESMGGSKIQMLQRAMLLVVSSLGPADRLSIIAFSDMPKRLLPLRRMTLQGQHSARDIINHLACSHGTSMYRHALKKAAKVLEDRQEPNDVSRIILLSDSVDAGNQHRQFRSGCRSESKKNNKNNQLSRDDAFMRCVSGLVNLVAHEVKLDLDFSSDSDPAEITAVYSLAKTPAAVLSDSDSVWIGDLYAGEEREFLLSMRVPASRKLANHAISVRCSYKKSSSQEVINCQELVIGVPLRSRSAGVERLKNIFIFTRALVESRMLQNDTATAFHLLGSARDLLMRSRSSSAKDCVCRIDAELAELQWRRKQHWKILEEEDEPTAIRGRGKASTPPSPWRSAKRWANLAIQKKSANRVADLYGLENARF